MKVPMVFIGGHLIGGNSDLEVCTISGNFERKAYGRVYGHVEVRFLFLASTRICVLQCVCGRVCGHVVWKTKTHFARLNSSLSLDMCASGHTFWINIIEDSLCFASTRVCTFDACIIVQGATSNL
eukprot:g2872.t1